MEVNLTIAREGIEPSVPQPLFDVEIEQGVSGPFDVSSDGQRFLVRRLTDPPRPFNLIVNWTGLLEKGGPLR
jgi:hypothetical protein